MRLLGRRQQAADEPSAVTPPNESLFPPSQEHRARNSPTKTEGGRDSVAVTADSDTLDEYEKRELFVQQLRQLGAKYLDESPKESPASIVQPISTEKPVDIPQASSPKALQEKQVAVAPSFSQVKQDPGDAVYTTSIVEQVGLGDCSDLLCGLTSVVAPSPSPERRPKKKSGGTRVESRMIPKTIDFEPVRVSSLDGESSREHEVRYLSDVGIDEDDRHLLRPLVDETLLMGKVEVNTHPTTAQQLSMSDTDVFEDLTANPRDDEFIDP